MAYLPMVTADGRRGRGMNAWAHQRNVRRADSKVYLLFVVHKNVGALRGKKLTTVPS